MSSIRLVTPYSKSYSSASRIPIHAHGLESWLRITTDENSGLSLHDAFGSLLAEKPQVKSIEESLSLPEETYGSMRLYVLSSESRENGASIILHPLALQAVYEKLGTSSVMFLPSSIHELLAYPYGHADCLADFADMVNDVNNKEVDPEERLDCVPWILTGGRIARFNPSPALMPAALPT